MKIIEKILPVPSNDKDKPKEGGHLFLDLAISLFASVVIFLSLYPMVYIVENFRMEVFNFLVYFSTSEDFLVKFLWGYQFVIVVLATRLPKMSRNMTRIYFCIMFLNWHLMTFMKYN